MAAQFIPQEIIRRKRDGATLRDDEIAAFVAGLTSGAVTEGQAAAFAMAVYFKGMGQDECVALTRAMMNSGDVLEWHGPDLRGNDLHGKDLPGPVVDKHSTGGVGDNVSLMLAPMLAACGAFVPMISGRGLGHTGGTLDKLDAVPGYATQPDNALFRKVVRDAGCAIIGQTGRLAPADKKLYAIRDVTATVESIPLITASILSKKLAAGLQGLVMDVKVGNGAFMADIAGARALAQSLAHVATGAGLPTSALLTGMDEPLASAAGNGLEALNAVDYLTGARRDARLHAVTMALCAEILVNGGLCADEASATGQLKRALASGAAAERFERMVAGLGGPRDFLAQARRHVAAAPVVRACEAERDGFVAAIDTRGVGVAVIALGGGRTRPQDAIDHRVGFSALVPLGTRVARGDALGLVHARTEGEAEAGAAALRAAYAIGDAAPAPSPAVIERTGGSVSA